MNKPSALGKAHLRVVRPSDDLAANVKFYRDGLGFEVLYEFKDHDGFDAVMLGHEEAAYHLAFVHKIGHKAGRAAACKLARLTSARDDACTLTCLLTIQLTACGRG